MPNDRIVFGVSTVFLFRHQQREDDAKVKDTAEEPITFEFAMKEKLDVDNKKEAAKKDSERSKLEAETAAKMEELNQKMEAERADQEA